MTGALATSRLTAEIEQKLSAAQRSAVVDLNNVVVSAGPGAGKTRTLAARVGWLLEGSMTPRQGVAAITFTRAAAREIEDRIERLGLDAGRRLRTGTVHAWCLRHILRPYGPLVGLPPPATGQIIHDDEDTWINLLQDCYDEVALAQNAAAFGESTRINRLRRQIASGHIGDGEEGPHVAAARLLDERMAARGLFDFDRMVSASLKIVVSEPLVVSHLLARFPEFVIDEYQDLGPVLHKIVVRLAQEPHVRVSAFGDPDQSIFGFTGADPKYMGELPGLGFAPHPLLTNFRCGSAIVAASLAALGDPRDHVADPERIDSGVLDIRQVSASMAAHAAEAVVVCRELTGTGVPLHQVAILYRQRGQLLDQLLLALDRAAIPYVFEDQRRLPAGDLSEFVQGVSARAVTGPQPAEVGGGVRPIAPTIRQLSADLQDLCTSAGLPRRTGREADRAIGTAVESLDAGTPLVDWLRTLDTSLNLKTIAASSSDARNARAWTTLLDRAEQETLGIDDLTRGVVRDDAITVTNYHKAKGREWDHIVLPGLADGIVPPRFWSSPDLSAQQMAEERRAFYVALTRAMRSATLICSDGYSETNRYGRVFPKSYGSGFCPFVLDIQKALDEQGSP